MKVFFNDASRGPANSLSVGGVTITGSNLFNRGQPATVVGIGLGSARVGPMEFIDRQEHYLSGSTTPMSPWPMEGLLLAVTGQINSVVLQPYFAIVGSDEAVFLPFDISYCARIPGMATNVSYLTPQDDSPIIVDLHQATSVDFGMD